ncbi:uncharacterized protein LOC144375002 [Ictidomys tridecemlineatus]
MAGSGCASDPLLWALASPPPPQPPPGHRAAPPGPRPRPRPRAPARRARPRPHPQPLPQPRPSRAFGTQVPSPAPAGRSACAPPQVPAVPRPADRRARPRAPDVAGASCTPPPWAAPQGARLALTNGFPNLPAGWSAPRGVAADRLGAWRRGPTGRLYCQYTLSAYCMPTAPNWEQEEPTGDSSPPAYSRRFAHGETKAQLQTICPGPLLKLGRGHRSCIQARKLRGRAELKRKSTDYIGLLLRNSPMWPQRSQLPVSPTLSRSPAASQGLTLCPLPGTAPRYLQLDCSSSFSLPRGPPHLVPGGYLL